jgi:lipopolysaccharide export system permease protein
MAIVISSLDRYILRQIWLPALLSAILICAVVIAGAIQDQIKLLLADMPFLPITFMDLGKISFFALPAGAGFIIPITFLIGLMMAFGRMAANYEIVALQASGISLKRIAFSVTVAGGLLSGLCFLIQDQARPWANSQLRALVGSDLPLRLTLDMLPPGIMHEFGEWRVYIDRREGDGTLHDITVLKPDDRGGIEAFYARSARVIRESDASYLELTEGYLIPDQMNRKLTFASLRQRIPGLKERYVPNAIESLTLAELLEEHRKATVRLEETHNIPDARQARRVRMEIADRFAFPLMCFALAAAAAPIGARAPRGAARSMTFTAGFLLAAAYFGLRRMSEIPFDPFNVPPIEVFVLAGQLPNFLLGALGGFFVWRLDRV